MLQFFAWFSSHIWPTHLKPLILLMLASQKWLEPSHIWPTHGTDIAFNPVPGREPT